MKRPSRRAFAIRAGIAAAVGAVMAVGVALAGTAPAGRFTVSNGTVHDTQTGLTWQQELDGSSYIPWTSTDAHCAALSLDGGGWRVPSLGELQTLVDDSSSNPAIDTTLFPGSWGEYYWTSSPLATDPLHGRLFVEFARGTWGSYGITGSNWVRCVRWRGPRRS